MRASLSRHGCRWTSQCQQRRSFATTLAHPSSAPGLNGFVAVEQASHPSSTEQLSSPSSVDLLHGSALDHAVDLRNVRPGDRLDIPYELTLSDTLQDFWSASFFDQSRIHSSTPFSRKLGFQDRVLPFSLALFLTSSMSHADAAKVQVGFGRVNYLWPLFSGDTVT
jgi:hypothetical protein